MPTSIHGYSDFDNSCEMPYEASAPEDDYELPSGAYGGYVAPRINVTHFNLEYAIQAILKIQKMTPLSECAQAYMDCENKLMKHAIDARGRPVEISVSYDQLFQEARELVRQHNPKISLEIFDKLLPHVKAQYSERLGEYPECSYRFSFRMVWPHDREEWHVTAPQTCMNAKMVKGVFLIISGTLARRIPGLIGSMADAKLKLMGLRLVEEGWAELPPISPFRAQKRAQTQSKKKDRFTMRSSRQNKRETTPIFLQKLCY